MAQVPLLVTGVIEVAKTRNVGARLLKVVIRLKLGNVREVIIGGEILVVINLVVEADGELVLVVASHGDRLILIRPDVGFGNKAEQVDRHWVLAYHRNLAGRKDVRPGGARHRRHSAQRVDGRGAARPPVEGVRNKLVLRIDAARERSAGVREVASTLRSREHVQQIARIALANPPAFIGYEEKGAVFLYRTAKRPAKLILVELRLDRIEVALCV